METLITPQSRNKKSSATLQIRDLHVYYNQSHALQGVNLVLDKNVLAVVGRNGMGKTTLCNAIMGIKEAHRGSIRFSGEEISNLAPYKIASRGIGYTPQGRRLWNSLSVEEHLRLAQSSRGAWNIERIYDFFPRIFERRSNGAGQLSGGEQQMLAISRSLLQNPELLILDEPTEGLAPIIVEQVQKILSELVQENDVFILLIEQNISVATSISEDVAVMVNGQINRVISSNDLKANRTLQQQLLGVGRHAQEDPEVTQRDKNEEKNEIGETQIKTEESPSLEASKIIQTSEDSKLIYVPPTRWTSSKWEKNVENNEKNPVRISSQQSKNQIDFKTETIFKDSLPSLELLHGEEVLVAGTFDTKGTELNFIRDRIIDQKLKVRTIDLSTSGKPSSANVPPHEVASYHPRGTTAVFTKERGDSVREMSTAFKRWFLHERDVGGIISAGGSGGTALVTPAMRDLPVGVPKVMISTVASGDVGDYVGPSDIMMMYSVTDIQGLNPISKRVLENGANALVGMVKRSSDKSRSKTTKTEKPSLGLTMFGVTTPAVQKVSALIEKHYDCLVFHATGTGGRSMEKLADSGLLTAAVDVTTTEICDMLVGGVFAADEDRFGAFIRNRIPYVGSLGAMDMVNFGPRDSVPQKFNHRTFVEHNPQVTLMRTTPEENTLMGEWIAGRLNQMTGPVRFLIPEGGVSSLDAPGQAFHDPEADKALFDSLYNSFQQTSQRKLLRVPAHINDQDFAEALVNALNEINPIEKGLRNAVY